MKSTWLFSRKAVKSLPETCVPRNAGAKSNARVLLFLLVSTVALPSVAQIEEGRYKVRIVTVKDEILKGSFLSMTDSTIRLRPSFDSAEDTIISYQVIETLKLRRRNNAGKGFLLGLATGSGLGALVGFISYSPPDCSNGWCLDFGPGFSALAGGLTGGMIGGLFGLGIGTSYQEFEIHGDAQRFRMVQPQLMQRSTRRKK